MCRVVRSIHQTLNIFSTLRYVWLVQFFHWQRKSTVSASQHQFVLCTIRSGMAKIHIKEKSNRCGFQSRQTTIANDGRLMKSGSQPQRVSAGYWSFPIESEVCMECYRQSVIEPGAGEKLVIEENSTILFFYFLLSTNFEWASGDDWCHHRHPDFKQPTNHSIAFDICFLLMRFGW